MHSTFPFTNPFVFQRQPRLPKTLLVAHSRAHGRNHQGRITVWHRGGGHKRRYRVSGWTPFVPFGRALRWLYHPYRNVPLCWMHHPLGSQGMVVSQGMPQNAQPAYYTEPSHCRHQPGQSWRWAHVPLGTLLHQVAPWESARPRYARSAGTALQLMHKKNLQWGYIKFPSGQSHWMRLTAMGLLGRGQETEPRRALNKAGHARWLNRRPRVRGVAMNPVDHPHGGGEGKTSGGRPSVSFTGRLTKGQFRGKKTRSRYVTRSA